MRTLACDWLVGTVACVLSAFASACSLVLPFGDYSDGSGASASGAAASSASGPTSTGTGGGCGKPPCVLEVLATNQGLPADFTAGAGRVAWIKSDTLLSLSASPSPGELPEEAPAMGPVTQIEFDGERFIALDKWRMVWHLERVDFRAPSMWPEIGWVGDTPSLVASGVGIVALGAYGSVFAISTNASQQFIDKWDEAASPNEVQSIDALAVSATDVFVADTTAGILKRCLLRSAPPQCDDFAVGQTQFVATRGSHVIWLDTASGAIQYCPASNCDPDPVTLAQPGTGAGITALALSTNDAYWVESKTGKLARCSVGGCPEGPTVLAEGLDTPTAMVIDGDALFVVEGGSGSILKLVLAP